jgi:hypothetical protein
MREEIFAFPFSRDGKFFRQEISFFHLLFLPVAKLFFFVLWFFRSREKRGAFFFEPFQKNSDSALDSWRQILD